MNDKKISLIISENIQKVINEAREDTIQQWATAAQNACKQQNAQEAINCFNNIYKICEPYKNNASYKYICTLSQCGVQHIKDNDFTMSYRYARNIWSFEKEILTYSQNNQTTDNDNKDKSNWKKFGEILYSPIDKSVNHVLSSWFGIR